MLSIAILAQKSFADKYENQRLLKEFAKLGHKVTLINIDNIILNTTSTVNADFYNEESDSFEPLLGFDIYFVREVFVYMKSVITLLQWLKTQATVVDNNLTDVQYLNDKLRQIPDLLKNEIPFPKTLFFHEYSTFINSLDYLETKLGYPVIAKKKGSGKGMGVYKFDNRKQLTDFFTQQIKTHRFAEKVLKLFIFQEFLPIHKEYRVFVLNNKVLGTMQRIPKEGDFRANFSLGGTVKLASLSPEHEQLCINAAKATKAYIAGVDLALTTDNKPYIIEVNRTPGFRGLEKATGQNIAKEIAKTVLEIAKSQN